MLLMLIIMTVIDLAVFMLYRIRFEAFLYSAVIIIVFGIIIFLLDYVRGLKKAEILRAAVTSAANGNIDLPDVVYLDEKYYRKIIDTLYKEIDRARQVMYDERQDVQDWYTVWVHQIKTPIAVMKLNIRDDDTVIANELFRIEEYADMALTYIRLSSGQNDLVIREYALDDLIRETLRRYAPQFIAKKIRLVYEPFGVRIITDRKWLVCVIDQLISNAVKYTNGGMVSIKMNGNALTVSDTGIGIAPEDMPRIFEKGYTGLNGRTGAKSSGLGLYLSKKAAELINIRITAESRKGEGSSFTLDFPENSFRQ